MTTLLTAYTLSYYFHNTIKVGGLLLDNNTLNLNTKVFDYFTEYSKRYSNVTDYKVVIESVRFEFTKEQIESSVYLMNLFHNTYEASHDVYNIRDSATCILNTARFWYKFLESTPQFSDNWVLSNPYHGKMYLTIPSQHSLEYLDYFQSVESYKPSELPSLPLFVSANSAIPQSGNDEEYDYTDDDTDDYTDDED